MTYDLIVSHSLTNSVLMHIGQNIGMHYCLFVFIVLFSNLFSVFYAVVSQRSSYGFQCTSVIVFLSVSVNVYVPKDRVTNLHQGYGFVEFRSEEDADYVSGALVACGSIGVLCIILTVKQIRGHSEFWLLFLVLFGIIYQWCCFIL